MRPVGISVSSLNNIQKFSLCSSLSLFFSLLMSMWRICSVSMNFACMLKLWLLSEKWRFAGIACGFHTSIWWLLSLILNSVPGFPTYCRLRLMKSKGVRQSQASSRNSEAIDVWKVTRHPPSRRMVACHDYSFKNTTVFFLLQWKAQTIIKLKLKQTSKEF